jgi:uncharacterized membrane protein
MGVQTLSAASEGRSWLRPKRLLFGFLGLMFVYVLTHNEGFLIHPDDPEWQHIATFKWWLLPHGLAGACALLIGPMQFSDRLRRRYLRLHRILGRIYIAGAFIAAPLGVYIQHRDEFLGIGCSRSFTIETMIQAGIWIFTTAMALHCIRKGKVQQHRQWMVRSFAAGPFVFMEGRVIDGLFGLGGSCATDEIVVWCCTATAVFLADFVMQLGELFHVRPGTAKSETSVNTEALFS